MKLMRKRALLATLLAGAWLPATITCNPGPWSGVIHISDEDDGIVVVDDGCRPCWFGDCCGDGLFFDFFYDD